MTEFDWHEEPVPAGFPVRQVHGGWAVKTYFIAVASEMPGRSGRSWRALRAGASLERLPAGLGSRSLRGLISGSARLPEVILDGRRDAVGVTRGEQVKQSTAQDGEQERALGLGFGRIAAIRGLALCQDLKPVVDGIPAEARPRSRLAEQGPGIALDPQGKQRPLGGRDQPGPDLAPGLTRSLAVPQLLQVAQLVLARPGEQGTDQPLFGAE